MELRKMVREVNTDEMSRGQEAELRAAFGDDAVDNGEVIELEPSDLAEPTPTRYPMEDALEVGDHVVIGSKRHDDVVGEGVIAEMNGYSMTFEDGSYHGFNSFGGERGCMFTIESVNGEDVEYGEVEVDE